MQTGLLWYDGDPNRGLAAKIEDAARRYREKFEGHHVAIIISGGNLDLHELREVINHYEQDSGY